MNNNPENFGEISDIGNSEDDFVRVTTNIRRNHIEAQPLREKNTEKNY